jgi:hypothetical protein
MYWPFCSKQSNNSGQEMHTFMSCCNVPLPYAVVVQFVADIDSFVGELLPFFLLCINR